MAKQIIGRGSNANDGTGDNLRDGANKINLNFNEIYTALGDGTTLAGTIKIADDSSTVMTLSANGETVRLLGGSGITSTISGNDLTLAVDGTVLSASQTSTLTNKTIDLDSNTITGTLAEFNTALQGDSFVTLTGSETLTNKTINASQLVDGSVSNAKLANSTITMIDDSSTTDAVSLGENFRFTGGTGIASTLGSNAVTFAIDNTVATLSGSQTLTNKTIVAGNNTISGITNAMLSGSAGITNANLANSSITLGDDTISLGGTDTSIANLSLTGATGTIDLTSQANKIRFNYNGTGNFPSASTYEGMFAYDYSGNNPYVADSGGWVKILSENSSISDLTNVGSIASISNGQALIWNSGAGRFDPGSAGGDVVDDTTPQLGGDLDAQGKDVQDVGYVSHRSPDATVTQTLTVTVVTKTTEHTAYGDGSSSGYVIDGHEGAHLQLSPGVYKFDLSDGTNSGHPFRLYDTASKTTQYTTGVTTSGSGGSSGDHLTITITKSTPSTLHYQCSSHANMGGVISIVGSENPRVTETLTLTDNLLFSTASKGVYLGVTSATASNLLDDYEEGTFTPVLGFGGGATGMAYTQQYGSYTKIGNMVHIKMRVHLSSKGSSTGDATITGFPFAPADNFSSVSFEVGKEVDTWSAMNTSSNYRFVHTEGNEMQLKRIDSNTTQSFQQQVSDSDFTDTSDIRISYSYPT